MHNPHCSPVAVAHRSLALMLGHPTAVLLFCALLLVFQLLVGLLVEKISTGVWLHLLSGTSPANLLLGAISLLVGLTILCGTSGAVILFNLFGKPSENISDSFKYAGEVSVLVLGTATVQIGVGGFVAVALGTLPNFITGELWTIVGFALLTLPAFILGGLFIVVGPLTIIRILAGESRGSGFWAGLTTLGTTLIDLLSAPSQTLATIGVQTLLATPLFITAFIATMVAWTTELPFARLTLLMVQSFCLGLAIIWIMSGAFVGLAEVKTADKGTPIKI